MEAGWTTYVVDSLPMVMLISVAVLISAGVAKIILTPIRDDEEEIDDTNNDTKKFTAEDYRVLRENPTALLAPSLQAIEEEKIKKRKIREQQRKKTGGFWDFTVRHPIPVESIAESSNNGQVIAFLKTRAKSSCSHCPIHSRIFRLNC